MRDKNGLVFGVGALASGATAALTTLCCVVPVAAGVLSAGAASLGAALEPYRPYFLGLTLLFLGFGFYYAYRPVDCCAEGTACATRQGRRAQRIFLWVITAVTLALATSPYWFSLYTYVTL